MEGKQIILILRNLENAGFEKKNTQSFESYFHLTCLLIAYFAQVLGKHLSAFVLRC